MSKIGFIGLGIMGSPMAGHLVRAGHDVTGFDLSEDSLARLRAAAGNVAGSVAEAVGGAEIIATMLPADPQVEAVVLGENGVLDNAGPGALLIDFSSITPQTSRRVAREGAAKGLRVLDAPVSGGERGAVDAVLSIMVGGSQEDFDAAVPIFETVGKTYRLVGPAGAGQYVKAANQLVVGGTYALVAEAIVLMEAAGVNAAAGLEVLAGGLAAGRILDLKREAMLARDFQPGFRIDLHHKDMGIVLEAARGAEVAIPMGALVAQLIASARAQGHGGLDHSALLKVAENLSGRNS
ncbi:MULTISPECIES: 2-hydroxy-3-oxopropionate reductase [Streptosporangium]|uniref:2-hydroxy-3-oxopropionate reductase n=1 Tax=Streptosporangium brasiliense TaxID=47480 RepID=A0ABT9RFX3_9ACTN|nr:2-hydroxy-3-oxopropionate reductase [Streptosporangium brasiliense]MDP9868188.1 2-hydroxy-3-oxopropionate reductase [Streptosporangium brasiliense]